MCSWSKVLPQCPPRGSDTGRAEDLYIFITHPRDCQFVPLRVCKMHTPPQFPHAPSLSCPPFQKFCQFGAVSFCLSWTTGETEPLLVLAVGFHLRHPSLAHFSAERCVCRIYCGYFWIEIPTYILHTHALPCVRCSEPWRIFPPPPTIPPLPSLTFWLLGQIQVPRKYLYMWPILETSSPHHLCKVKSPKRTLAAKGNKPLSSSAL